MRAFPLDGAKLWFDRTSGATLVRRDASTAAARQGAPRFVQFGITNACNLACGFCSRDVEASTDWDPVSAFEVLRDLSEAGVLEVAFGGGEPLAARGFDELVRRLHQETQLAVGFTTNGLLLSEERLEALAPYVSQVRLSLYPDNDWRRTASRLGQSAARFGANLMVTPHNLDELGGIAVELAEAGCSDLLVLAYTGPDPEHHLSAIQDEQLSRGLRALHRALHGQMGLAIDVCFGDRLDVPRLVDHRDCQAGRDALVLTSDRRVQACSFQSGGMPFVDAQDALRIWREEQERLRRAAPYAGCARHADHGLGRRSTGQQSAAPAPQGWSLWAGFASNNSGAYTLLGRFLQVDDAQRVAEVLADLVAEEEAFLRDASNFEGGKQPSTPLWEFTVEHGLEGRKENWDWPMDFADAPEVESAQHQVVVHCQYTVGMPQALGQYFYANAGKVQLELDHTHEALLLRAEIWVDWNAADREERMAKVKAALEERFPGAAWEADPGHGAYALWTAPEDLMEEVRTLRAFAAEHDTRLSLWFEESRASGEDPLAFHRPGSRE